MNKLTNLVISAVVALPLFSIAGTVAENSKNQIKANINLCELKIGERGWAKGQVISVEKGDWGNKLVTIGEGTEGCRVTIKTNPNKNFLLQQIGARVKILIKVDTEYFASAIGDTAKEDRTVIGADGTIVPVQTVELKISTSVLEEMRKYEEARLNVTNEFTSYLFTRELLNQIEGSKLYRWYYQETGSGLRIVNRVEPVN